MPHQGPLSLDLSKAARRASALALILFAAGSAVAEPPLTLPPIDQIVVHKAARTMELYAEGRLAHTIAGIQLGSAPTGAKRFQGDDRTPEGRYAIDYGNPASSYYLSLHISYPNAEDAAFARARGRSPGGLIFIHGQPNDYAYDRVPGDWTDGCIAVSDEEIAALWQAVGDRTVIDIVP